MYSSLAKKLMNLVPHKLPTLKLAAASGNRVLVSLVSPALAGPASLAGLNSAKLLTFFLVTIVRVGSSTVLTNRSVTNQSDHIFYPYPI